MHLDLYPPRLAGALLALALLAPAGAAAADWSTFGETKTIEILTQDEGGDARETKVWIVVVDGSGYVRTNDSRWLANIRRGSPVEIRAGETTLAVGATEVEDEAIRDQVEEAFKAKYGAMQKLMSFFRISEPTVLRLEAGS
jgi:hypothetical protein